jgi:DNA mismatch repair protein MutS2
LDLACAKGEYAIHLEACEPLLNHKGRIHIRQGRHPLLDAEKCVPVSVKLGDAAQALLITGPNTGGKTVTLKTLGLFTLMAQSGLQVPCQSGSELAMFDQVFADIGDEQSIAQNLSTFSGHVANIVRILKVCGRRALVLLDELGSGTDPAEGAALAKSILSELLAHNARIVATTHYGELKEFAYSRDGVENAAVEFDVETLKPTYRLLQGVPGSSNAFHIARRLGMPNRVVDAAVASLGSAGADAAEVMLRLEAAKKAAEDEHREAERLRKELADLRAKHAKRLEDLERLRAEAKERASEEARLLIRQKTEKMDNIISELRRMGKEGRKTQSARKKMKETSEELVGQIGHEKEPPPVDEADIPSALAKGDTVRVTSLGGATGVVVENTSGAEAIVQVGVMRVTVPMTGLRIVGVSAAKQKPKAKPSIADEVAAMPPIPARSKGKERPVRDVSAKPAEPRPEKDKKQPRAGGLAPRAGNQLSSVMIEKASSFSHELMLIGMRVDAALPRLDKWLDDAVLAGLDGGRVVHGKGTGALKRAVWEQLSGDSRVVAYQLSHPDEGGAGVTVIRFA